VTRTVDHREIDMAEVVLFHHALGLTKGIAEFADELRRAGHTVWTPDLFEGRTFDSIESGMGYVEGIGFGEVISRGGASVADLPTEVVYAGFSLGVVSAQMLAQTRAGARGALLYYSCVPVTEFGTAWPAGVPVQVHGKESDPFFADEGDLDAARALVTSTPDAELFLYEGDQHYFADSTLPTYDADAAKLLLDAAALRGRVLHADARERGQLVAAQPAQLDAMFDAFDPLTAADIADLIAYTTSRARHVNLRQVVVLPTRQA
jgi:dienelactone hydrolase